MAMRLSDGIDRVRRPEYTGENRCVPCTVVNLLIAVVLAVLTVSAGVWIGAPVGGAVAGAAVYLVSLVAISLRGYLVPGTPWFTKTYFPAWLLRHFDKHGSGVSGGVIDTESTLLQAGVVTECEREDDLCLVEDFRVAWREQIAALHEGDAPRDDLAGVLGVEADRLSFEDHGGSFVALVDARRVGQWESHEAFVADMAAAREIDTRFPGWTDLDVRHRSTVLNGLRIFLEWCPGCDGPASIDTEVVESCCRSIDVVAVSCEECGARLFEAQAPD